MLFHPTELVLKRRMEPQVILAGQRKAFPFWSGFKYPKTFPKSPCKNIQNSSITSWKPRSRFVCRHNPYFSARFPAWLFFFEVDASSGRPEIEFGAAAVDFYTNFYARVRSNLDIGKSVREAALEVRRSENGDEIGGLMNRRNPCFWAGFQFLGE